MTEAVDSELLLTRLEEHSGGLLSSEKVSTQLALEEG